MTATPERRNVEIKSVDSADVGLSGKPESTTNFSSFPIAKSCCILTQNFSKVSSSAVIVFVTPDGPRTRNFNIGPRLQARNFKIKFFVSKVTAVASKSKSKVEFN